MSPTALGRVVPSAQQRSAHLPLQVKVELEHRDAKVRLVWAATLCAGPRTVAWLCAIANADHIERRVLQLAIALPFRAPLSAVSAAVAATVAHCAAGRPGQCTVGTGVGIAWLYVRSLPCSRRSARWRVDSKRCSTRLRCAAGRRAFDCAALHSPRAPHPRLGEVSRASAVVMRRHTSLRASGDAPLQLAERDATIEQLSRSVRHWPGRRLRWVRHWRGRRLRCTLSLRLPRMSAAATGLAGLLAYLLRHWQVNGQAETALALQGELGRSVGLEAAMAEELQALRTKLERSSHWLPG